MSVDTKAILNGSVSFEEIKEYLDKRFTDVKAHDTSCSDFIQITFLIDGDRN